MKNEEIILRERLRLMIAGKIGSTGATMVIEKEDGSTEEISVPEELHTWEGWRRAGYRVKHGEHAIATFPIWKHCRAGEHRDRKTGETVQTPEKMIMTKAFFFKFDQCEKIEEEESRPYE